MPNNSAFTTTGLEKYSYANRSHCLPLFPFLSFLQTPHQKSNSSTPAAAKKKAAERGRVAKSKNPHFWFPGRQFGISISSQPPHTHTHTQPDQNGTPDATQQPNGHSPVPGTQHTGELAGGGWWAYLIDDVVPHESAGHEALVFIQQASYS